MPGHDIVVVGASAGGVEALQALVRGMPVGLQAAVFIVLHVPAQAPSLLPAILTRQGHLPVSHAISGETIQTGRIYIAPPDHHLIINNGYVQVSKGPKENRHRPSVDVLFRSAARVYGPRVIGVILSGTLDDGVVGLHELKRCGGLAVVQDPEDALYPEMPLNALGSVSIDYKAPALDMGALLARLSVESAPGGEYKVPEGMDLEIDVAKNEVPPGDGIENIARASDFTCPECHGTLFEMESGEMLRFRCRVGHAYTADSLVADHAEALESALWVALRNLEESAALSRRMAERALREGHNLVYRTFLERAEERDEQAEVIRRVLLADKQPSGNEADSMGA